MKIIYVLRSIAIHGGIERVVVDKINFLAEHGHQVMLVTYEQGHHPIEYPILSCVKHIDIECPMYPFYRLRKPLRIMKMLKMKRTFKYKFHKLVSDIRPDIIVIVTNASDFMNEVMTTPYGKKIVESHGAFPAIMNGYSWKTKIRTHMVLKAITKCDLLISLTRADAECWKSHVKNVQCVPNPVSFYIEKLDMSLKKEGRILFVGRLSEEKRIDRLIEAFSMIAPRFPSWYIDIFGAGEKKEEVKGLIEKNNLNDRIHLLEPIQQIIDEYQKSQFLVSCSDNEGFGLVLIEAMACGLPCISTRCPFGPQEIIEDGITGLLCDMNSNDLANKMEWMITHEKERKKMGIKAHESAEKYKKDVIMKEWEEAYVGSLNQ